MGLADGLLKRSPDSAKAARDVWVSLNKLGGFLASRGQSGDADRALKYFERGLDLAEGLLKLNPDSAPATHDVSVNLMSLGDILARRGQPDDADRALKYFERGLELCEGLRSRNPDSAQAARDVSVSLSEFGDFLAGRRQSGDADRALGYYERGLELFEGLRSRNPDSAQATHDGSVIINRLGDFLAKRGQPGDADRALKYFEHGLELCKGLQSRNLDSDLATRGVIVSYCKLAELKIKAEDFDSAIAYFERGIQMLDAMIAKRLYAETAEQEKAMLVGRVRFCRLLIATGDWNALLKRSPADLAILLPYRATEMARRGQLGEVDRTVSKLRELEPKTGCNL